jgi:hypothetical protein
VPASSSMVMPAFGQTNSKKHSSFS